MQVLARDQAPADHAAEEAAQVEEGLCVRREARAREDAHAQHGAQPIFDKRLRFQSCAKECIV